MFLFMTTSACRSLVAYPIVLSCDPEFHRWSIEMCGVLHFGGNNLCIQRLTCHATSASAEHLLSHVCVSPSLCRIAIATNWFSFAQLLNADSHAGVVCTHSVRHGLYIVIHDVTSVALATNNIRSAWRIRVPSVSCCSYL